ncbi:hypothetical protein INR49_009173 [Caranx melampygus]|nr:hypothetical protein INR49_009173 [Caranx melampygus]
MSNTNTKTVDTVVLSPSMPQWSTRAQTAEKDPSDRRSSCSGHGSVIVGLFSQAQLPNSCVSDSISSLQPDEKVCSDDWRIISQHSALICVKREMLRFILTDPEGIVLAEPEILQACPGLRPKSFQQHGPVCCWRQWLLEEEEQEEEEEERMDHHCGKIILVPEANSLGFNIIALELTLKERNSKGPQEQDRASSLLGRGPACAAVLCFDHRVSPCSQRAHGFKPDRGFIFRFGGSAVDYRSSSPGGEGNSSEHSGEREREGERGERTERRERGMEGERGVGASV